MVGVQGLILTLILITSVFQRWTKWWPVAILIVATTYNLVEYGRTLICGGWYNFVYSGPPLMGDRCELMLGMTLDKPIFFAITTSVAIMLPTILKNQWGRRGTEHT